jgi:hypothetical protein
MVQAYRTFFGQSKSPPLAIHCFYLRIQIVGVSATAVPFAGEWPTVAVWRFRKEAGGEKYKGK